MGSSAVLGLAGAADRAECEDRDQDSFRELAHGSPSL